MNEPHEAPSDDFALRLAEGRTMISKLWPRLQLGTQDWLMKPDDNGQSHFDKSGRILRATLIKPMFFADQC